MNATKTKPDILPAEPTERDYQRVGALVSLARGGARPDAPWSPDDCVRQLRIARELLPFPELAVLAVNVAKEPRYSTPAMIHFAAAGAVKP